MKAMDATAWSKGYPELKSFVYRRVRDRQLAEDIVQDVFLKVHAKLGQLKEAEKISGWIYQITRNLIADHFRRKSKSAKPMDLDWESDPKGLNDCVAACLNQMLVTLPEKYKEALLLTEVHDLSQTALAEKLNISYSGAKSRVQRAREMLKKKMDEEYLIETDSYGNVIVCEGRQACNCHPGFAEGIKEREAGHTYPAFPAN